MNFDKIIEQLYQKDGIRNREYLDSILHEDFELEWDSSFGHKVMFKDDILYMADELKANYHTSNASIIDIIEDKNKLVVHYLHHASTIENPKDLFTIAKVVVIWEFQNDKIYKGYQISKAG